MNLQELKDYLQQRDEITFVLPSGEYVPPHFHVTEVGKSSKLYVDCGGTVRAEEVITFQLWSANDYDHRIQPQKILQIIEIAEDTLGLENLEVEIEYQRDTIGRYGLSIDKDRFLLTPTQTDCLAKDKCGIPEQVEGLDPEPSSDCCPDSGCC
ncbi:MAG: DUF6428 family protein [Verrucomicrobiota bacterium]|nr:DUF6428 family protein [Verrucomicrobiota bacterium]